MIGARLHSHLADIIGFSLLWVSIPVMHYMLQHQPEAQAFASWAAAVVVAWRIVFLLRRAFRAWRVARDAGKVIGQPLKRRNRR